MAHFAEIDENNVVLRVVVVNNSDIQDESGNENEILGRNFCVNLFGGSWIQTSYNKAIRKSYAGIGYTYNPIKDVFIMPQPYSSWALDENSDWQAPIPEPDDGYWSWDEDNQQWVEIEIPEA
jgi:hypothetical protein